MNIELETAGAASAGGLSTAQKADLAGQPCKNCGEVNVERFCSNCGQLAASFHRPVLSLIGETITDTLALDGRIARTLPILMLRPGKLTKAYTSGKRGRYVPPFRLFLLASLVFYLALFSVIGRGEWLGNVQIENPSGEIATISTSDLVKEITDEAGDVDAEALRDLIEKEAGHELDAEASEFVLSAGRVVEDPRLFFAELEQWGPRLSFLLVPITILALTLIHAWKRRIYVYDHAIHAMHLHTWMYLAGALLIFAIPPFGGTAGWVFGIGLIIYVWRSLMVVGESGIFMAFLRLFIMLLIWVVATSAIVLASVIISGLNASSPAAG